jgi:hypothetical protein
VRKLFATLSLSAACLCAQTSTTSSTQVDVNGNRIPNGPQVTTTKNGNDTQTTVTMQSINGRTVPLERVEEKVLRDDASGRVVERTIRRFDPQGNPTPPEREMIEEQKRPDGGSTTVATTYRGNINGQMQVAQKAITELSKSGSEEHSDTVVQRPTINGGLDTVEKQSTVKVASADGFREESTTYRPGGSGGFYPAVRTVTEHTQQGTETQENTVEYEANPSGPLQIHSQTVTKTVTAPDGSKDTVLNIYGTHTAGTVDPTSSAMKLQEQQIVQSQKGPNDTVTQTLSVRRPTVSDPNTLGPARQLSQTVCTGDCKP